MRVGMCIPFMNHAGVDDHELMKGELALGDLAEPLGFDSLWCFEHHFTSYMLSPNPLQILTYFAGRTRRIQLGTMVVVLPWHHPVRVAEQVLLLDHFSHGRTLLGVGRGIGRIEYEKLGVDQAQSKALSIELIRCLTSALESGICEYEGEHVRQPKVQLRPGPFRSFRDRIFIGAGSPETSPMCAELGVIYTTRPKNNHAKAGNLNYAFEKTSSEFLIIFDADHVPEPHFITRLIGYFADEKLAFVQTPHAFYNFDSFQARLNHGARKYWEEGQLFYHVIQPGRNRTGCPIFAGSAAMFRRSALKEVGYIATETITEDMHTGLRMHSRGWKSLGTRRSISTSVGASRGSGASGMSALKPLPSAGRFSMCSLRSVTRRTTSRITPPNGRGLHARAPGTLRRRAIGCRRG